jgi:NAD(P)-dependent dehydrogenase (short-subunit alcohol dehydrogenase family)
MAESLKFITSPLFLVTFILAFDRTFTLQKQYIMEQRKIWIITGASQGLGLATVKYLLSRGQRVVATARNRDDFHRKTGLRHPRLEVIGLDLSSEQAVQKALQRIFRTYGRLDVLINNVPIGRRHMMRHILPYMRIARSGHIFNLSAKGGVTAFPGFNIYNATEFAVEGFSPSMRAELKEQGINITTVEPGYFQTSFLENSPASKAIYEAASDEQLPVKAEWTIFHYN